MALIQNTGSREETMKPVSKGQENIHKGEVTSKCRQLKTASAMGTTRTMTVYNRCRQEWI
jgi:hypothetical protein